MMNSKDVCIVIPVYRDKMSESERLSFDRTLNVFSKREIRLIGPKQLNAYFAKLSEQHENVSFTVFPDFYFKKISGYNRLLMSSDFYQKFSDFEYILICQLDVFVIKDELGLWIEKGKDNIGAPIFEGYTKPSLEFKKGNNGGFCLRRTKSCIKVLSQIRNYYSPLTALWKMESKLNWRLFRVVRDGLIYNYKTKILKPIINEDVFWSVIVPERFSWFKACEPEEAKYFAFDANPKYLFQECNYQYPMAIHAWLRYDKPFTMDLINQF
ncbi:DUF5672 family protein [Maribellus maritimus]|uniref:DUF5672 family protein n=1 Tax=Maribellus maritimus TaxID=2870838 RepID=UPI001EECDE68|nr:DUF5672 family protein [Maribellus maritimus]MCG6190246.1 hypothetical protein [Maribellus maritimus]